MPINLQHRRKGFSLLELMLVLVLVAVIVTIGLGRYKLYQREKDIAALQQNIDMVFLAFDTYYRTKCKASQPFVAPHISALNVKFLPTNLVASPADYYIIASSKGNTAASGKPIYSLTLVVTLNVPFNTSPATMAYYQQVFNALGVAGNELIWTRLPSYTIPTVGGGLWISGAGLRTFKEGVADKNIDDSCAY